jgi:tetratricopeptide (TPR) repeat protein/predicted Ser/Thr protein kinase/TolB-like protein
VSLEGKHISHYRITGLLGKGGMGEVWRAVDERLGRSVALKFPAQEQTSGRQLADEARVASRLNHPNVAQIYEFGESEEGVFIAMELVRGKPLTEILAAGPMPADRAVAIVRAVAEALGEAHAQGVLHLDIKPGNIAIDERGAVKVLDFGLAKALPRAEVELGDDLRTQTLATTIRGTPSYMSPEQARGEPLDGRSDLFSLGAVLWECLTGRRAFDAPSAVGTLLEIVSANPPAPSKVAGAPSWLNGVVAKLLAKNREDRYAAAAELIAALDTGSRGRAPLTVSRRTVLAAALVICAIGAAGGWTLWKRMHAGSQPIRQVVVLPFENPGNQTEYAAFCEGLAEVVAGMLSRQGARAGVWVLPSIDVRRFNVQTVSDAGRTLHADLAIGGTARRNADGSGWTIVISLSDAAHPHVIGTRMIRVDDRDAQAIEKTLSGALTELMEAPFQSPGKSPTTYARFVTARGHLRQYDKGDNLQRAIDELEAITRATPSYAPAQLALSEAYYRQYTATRKTEWIAKADQAAARTAELSENEPGLHLMRGRILRATGETDAAIGELNKALAADPGDVAALLQLAGVYDTAARPADAEATYQKAIRLRPSYYQAYNNLGIFYMSQGKWQAAEEPMRLLIQLAPEYAEGLSSFGSLEYYLGHLDEARRAFTRSIELKPTANAYSNRCGVEFDTREFEAAVADCRKAVEIQPASAIAWGNLGDALAESGQADEARHAYETGLAEGRTQTTVNPKDVDLLASMAKYAAKIGQKDMARQLAERALKQGASVRALYNTAKAYGLSGDCRRAAELLQQALEKGYPRSEARRDPDLTRLRAAPLACAVPPL